MLFPKHHALLDPTLTVLHCITCTLNDEEITVARCIFYSRDPPVKRYAQTAKKITPSTYLKIPAESQPDLHMNASHIKYAVILK